jgi:uncharacterized oligopeptide transporter (OPT) family protein
MAELVNGGAVASHVVPTCIAAAICVALLPLAELLAPCLGFGSGVEGAAKGATLQHVELAVVQYHLQTMIVRQHMRSDALPIHAKWISGCLAVRERLPSGIAVAIGMYVTPNWTIPRVIGGFTNYLWKGAAPDHARRYMIVLASGFVLGEGVISIVTAVLQSLGIGIASCWGCPEPAIGGFCGGCYDTNGNRL